MSYEPPAGPSGVAGHPAFDAASHPGAPQVSPGGPVPAGAQFPYQAPGAGYSAASPPWVPLRSRRGFKLTMFVGAIMLCALLGLGVLIYVGQQIGPVALSVGILAAVLPVPLLVFCFLWLDRYEPEPVKYLAFCFAWGAGTATALSLLVNTLSSVVFAHSRLPDTLAGVVVAPIIEESTKAAGPLLVFLLRRKSFSGLIDGIVYCGLSATGFAMVENVLYLGGFGYAKSAEHGGPLAGAAGVVVLFFARIVMTGFAHPLFTSMTGIGLGIASRARARWARVLAPIGGLLVAMTLHGSWNLMATIGGKSGQPLILLYWYVAVMMPVFFGMVGFALWLRSAEGRLAERVLGVYVRAGWFSPPEVAALATLGRRMTARHWAKQVAGETGAKAMRAYQFEATKLALLRDRMHRGLGLEPGEVEETLAEERRLLAAIAGYRFAFTGRDARAPRAVWDGLGYRVVFPDGVVRALRAPEQPVVPLPVTLTRAAVPYPFPYPYPYYR